MYRVLEVRVSTVGNSCLGVNGTAAVDCTVKTHSTVANGGLQFGKIHLHVLQKMQRESNHTS